MVVGLFLRRSLAAPPGIWAHARTLARKVGRAAAGSAVSKDVSSTETAVTPTGDTYHSEGSHVLHAESPSAAILSQPFLVISRQLEMLNVLAGIEQGHQYTIQAPDGTLCGYLVERTSMLSIVSRQVLRTHRGFQADVLDPAGTPLLTFNRPPYLINSNINVHDDVTDKNIGEVHQRFHLVRRNYDLFARGGIQFGAVNGGILAMEFSVEDESGLELARVDRNFVGLARELFTDTGRYVVRFDPYAGTDIQPPPGRRRILTYDERATVLAMAVSIDFDYFSRHSGGPGLFTFAALASMD
eukprot:m.244013 g.244013  ORF g.244013 m.244013 type:complete len:299 (+) comp14371_c0_seq1:30-926(+)